MLLLMYHLRQGWRHLFEPDMACAVGWRVPTAW